MRTNIIYGLRDPRNDVYHYVGKSTVGDVRALSHLKLSHSKKVNEWVDEVRHDGFEPLVDVIEEVLSLNDLPEREKYWIQHYTQINPNMLNSHMVKTANIYFTYDEMERVKLLNSELPELYLLLKKGRKCRKLSRQEMSDITGISVGTIKRMENGETSVGLNSFLKYLKVFGWDVDNILATRNENTGVPEGV